MNLTIGSLNVFMEEDDKSSSSIAAEAMFKMKELHKIMEGDRDALKEMMTETDDEGDEVEEYVDAHKDLGRKAITGTGDIVYG